MRTPSGVCRRRICWRAAGRRRSAAPASASARGARHRRDELVAAAVDGADDRWATPSSPTARRAALIRVVRADSLDEAVTPDPVEQLGLEHHPVAVRDQVPRARRTPGARRARRRRRDAARTGPGRPGSHRTRRSCHSKVPHACSARPGWIGVGNARGQPCSMAVTLPYSATVWGGRADARGAARQHGRCRARQSSPTPHAARSGAVTGATGPSDPVPWPPRRGRRERRPAAAGRSSALCARSRRRVSESSLLTLRRRRSPTRRRRPRRPGPNVPIGGRTAGSS